MISNLLVKYRYWILGLTLALSGVCAVLMFHVSINTDMTKYLPNDSRMKAGLDIMQNEFGLSADMAGSDIRVMTLGQTESEKVDMRYQLGQMPEVKNVTVQENADRTLYELGVSKSVDQVALGHQIRDEFEGVEAVETAQDGATADAPMLIGALALLFIVLAAMCSSWLEPVLFLASTGVAVLLNNGSNALLPSVSMTTNSIAAILQLVLSMDYSIILINRFRQERILAPDSPTAMTQAIRHASPSILSSALTTVVGLMMLVFMKLKIGADLGIVLSKGVVFSLICNFTILPSLILIFEKGIDKTQKKVLALPTDRLANFSMRFRVPLAIFFVVLIAGSYILHNQTPISFLNAQASTINEYFPKKNPVILVYDNADEDRVAELVDSLSSLPGVEMALSYPSLMLKEYTAPQMVAAIKDMSDMVNQTDSSAVSLPTDLLTEDVLNLVYFAAKGKQVETLNFTDLSSFIIAQSKDPKSIIASQMSPEMKQNLALLEDFRQLDDQVQEDLMIDSAEAEVGELAEAFDIQVEEPEIPVVVEPEPKHNVEKKQAVYSPFTDTIKIRKPLTSEQMADFLGMSAQQSKMVYRLAKNTQMSALQFVHFLCDDILKRKALAAMIDEEQRSQLLALRSTMDSANSVVAVAVHANESPVVATVMEQKKHPAEKQLATKDTAMVITPQLQTELDSVDDPMALLDEMMYGNKRYTPREMAQNFSAMGEPVNPALMELLYLYYGGAHSHHPEWTMSLSGMISFLGDSVMNDPRFATFITQEMREGFAGVRNDINDKLGMMRSQNKSIAMVITNLPTESDETYAFLNRYQELCESMLSHDYYSIGESVMLGEMKSGFKGEMLFVTILTILAIFLIVALTFRSLLLALVLVATVMTGVFVDVSVSAIGGGSLLYMAYLVVQSILMGAAIDYGILFANYYRENRASQDVSTSLRNSYKHSIHTILTSGLILILVPGAMAVLVSDVTISSIVRSIAVGALATVLLVLLVLPGILATCDKIIVRAPKK